MLWDSNRADDVLEVAVSMLRGELALARGQRKPGLAALRAAVAAEDRLNYNEPPDWPLPVRPYLGAALLDAKRPKEAAAVYAQDLAKYPDNGWSLYGLARAQQALKQADAAADSERRYVAAWQWADTSSPPRALGFDRMALAAAAVDARHAAWLDSPSRLLPSARPSCLPVVAA